MAETMITLALNEIEQIILTLDEMGNGSITSTLHVPPGQCEEGAHQEEDCPYCADDQRYNAAIDGIEALVLAHACAGVEVDTPSYLTGLRTAVDAVAQNT